MSELYDKTYNPDVLSCLANLSNDEVLTPPEVANQMLDMLPEEIWSDPEVTFLDPACKSGVFLREIAKRLDKGLEVVYPDRDERVEHIFKHQLHGVAITELTSLMSRRSVYCSKYPNCKYSIVEFDNPEGNIRFRQCDHTWVNGRCKFCGAAQSELDRDESLESHAYEFIHTTDLKGMLPMKFDVVVGNPPYQLNDGGNGKSAKPIYHLFVNQAKKLNPRYLLMIIPSRWFSGGKGLGQFRKDMLSDSRIRRLVDYENFKDVFPGVDLAGGACYFLWDRNYSGPCEVVNRTSDSESSMVRSLSEYETFIRQNLAVDIVRKILAGNPGPKLSDRISSRKPFGLPTNYQPSDAGIPCWFIQRIGQRFAKPEDVTDSSHLLDKWKLLIPKSPIAGQTDFTKPVGFYYDGNTRISRPGECCTESWLVACAFDTEEEVLSFKSYLFTKTVRFLLMQTVVSQDVTRKNFCFIPDVTYDHEYTDAELCEAWGITDEEWTYIDSRIGTITGEGNHRARG